MLGGLRVGLTLATATLSPMPYANGKGEARSRTREALASVKHVIKHYNKAIRCFIPGAMCLLQAYRLGVF